MRAFIKSLIFNIAFFTYCIVASLFFVWVFVLPRKAAWAALRYYFVGVLWVERLFLGLDYYVEGLENLPPKGTPFILAVKHYSAYETLKVPVIFDDIAIILKKELTWIPFWGWYTLKGGMIPVDRGGGAKALASLVRGGRRVAAQGRPILIFPQGTRVSLTDTTADKPYKVGIAKIANNLDLPIVPVAINSGVFWAKHSFMKRGGVVDFKILPMIPAGLPAPETLKTLEAVLEPACAALVAEAKTDKKYIKNFWPRWLKFLLVIFLLWAAWWHALAYGAQQILTREGTSISSPHAPVISGFPLAMHLRWPDIRIDNGQSVVSTPLLEASLWPLPAAPVWIATPQGFTVEGQKNISIDTLKIDFRLPKVWTPVDDWTIDVKGTQGTYGDTAIVGQGVLSIPLKQESAIEGVLQTQVSGYKNLIDSLVAQNVIDTDKARLANGFFDAMATAQGQTGAISFPLKVTNNVVYAGFIRVFEITRAPRPVAEYEMPPQKNRSFDWATSAPPTPEPQIQAPAVLP